MNHRKTAKTARSRHSYTAIFAAAVVIGVALLTIDSRGAFTFAAEDESALVDAIKRQIDASIKPNDSVVSLARLPMHSL